MKPQPILPGATLGVLGSGQLGRMFAIAARRMGYRVHVLSPDTDTPTGQVADVEINAAYEDMEAVGKFVRDVDVVTFEFENVPVEATELAARHVPVRPAGRLLHVAQHRLREKSFLRDAGLPTAPFAIARSQDEFLQALDTIGCPAVAKTAGFGYDGKGQVLVHAKEDGARAWQQLGSPEVVLEGFIDFEREVSVIVARDMYGGIETYGPMANDHQNHILDVSSSPANIAPAVAQAALAMTRELAESIQLVGVLCVEMFLTRDERLLINELAPRPHNSGHLTIDAHETCQFEQQVRAVCGLRLGASRQHTPAAMANVLGDVWQAGPPAWDCVAAMPEVKLHLYGKREPRPGRKMGHLVALAATADQAIETVREARNRLSAMARDTVM